MIVVLGASGQLGSAFARLLGDSAMPVTRADLDLDDTDRIEGWVKATAPEVLINCAAFTGVDAAESRPHDAYRINAEAVGRLALGAAETDTRLVTFSTDYVFDGSKGQPYVESDEPNPLNVYGSTKAEGERLALQENPDTLVVRTSWVMSSTHDNFIRTILRLLRSGSVSVVDDQIGRPTFVDDLARAVMEAVATGTSGMLHLTNQGETTWCGLAREIAELSGSKGSVSPITTAESDRAAPRPADTRLESERLQTERLTPLPHYRPSLERAVASIVSEGSMK